MALRGEVPDMTRTQIVPRGDVFHATEFGKAIEVTPVALNRVRREPPFELQVIEKGRGKFCLCRVHGTVLFAAAAVELS